MRTQSQSPIILLGARLLSPYIMVFGWYVIFHGHYSPGGGFQGGALLAASLLLIRVAGGSDLAEFQIREFATTPLAIIGVVIYFATGLAAMMMGGYFLDYAQLPIPGMEADWIRYTGILIVEVGIGIAVMAILVMIYDNMVRGEDYV